MMTHDKRLKLILASMVLGLGLGAPAAFADDWDQARDRLRRAEEELGKDTRQYNEARAKRDRKGMENEWNEIQKDRADIARRRAELDGMRRMYDVDRGWGYDGRGWGRHEDRDWGRYEDRDWDGPGRRGRGWAWGHHKQDRDEWRSHRRDHRDAWRELRKDRAEHQKDHEELRDAWRRGDRRAVENERREILRDHREIERDRSRIGELNDHGH
jgi:hypothetical protein